MLPTMYRIICLSLICASSQHAATAAERSSKEAYESLATMQGNDYATARDGFLAREGVKGFLQSRIRQNPDDWFAFALWQRIVNRNFVDLYDRLTATPRVKDRFVGKDFGRGLFNPDPIAFHRTAFDFPRLHSSDGQDRVDEFDWMREFALEMEWLLRNPHGYSICARFWFLYRFCWGSEGVPITKGDLENPAWSILKEGLPISKKSFKTLDPDRMKSWLAYARDHEREPIVRMLVARRLPGKDSCAVLEELSKKDSLIGTLAAFFYAGQTRYWSYPLSGGQLFNGLWLEQWVRRATRNQMQAADWIFAGNEQEGQPRSNRAGYKALGFPMLTSGLLIKHHPTQVGAEMKRRYHEAVMGQVETFKEVSDGYNAQEDGYMMETLEEYAKFHSMLWPKTVADELKKINTRDRKVRALIAKALEQLGQRTYPTGEDLQAIYGPKKEK